MKLSIITPSYNQDRYLEECLVSVKSQNCPFLEHIVIDGASTDGSVDTLRRVSAQPGWEHLKWISEPDGGQTDAINKGFRLATGDLFAYICADDGYVPDVLSTVVSHFAEHPELDMIYGSCIFTDEDGRPLRFKRSVAFDRKKLLRHNLIWQPTVFFRSRVWVRIGPFDEALDFAMDYDYWLRGSAHCKIASLDRPIAYYRWQTNSKTVSREHDQLKEAYEVACKYGGGGVLSWYLHRLYWPNTSRFKRWIFASWFGRAASSRMRTSFARTICGSEVIR